MHILRAASKQPQKVRAQPLEKFMKENEFSSFLMYKENFQVLLLKQFEISNKF